MAIRFAMQKLHRKYEVSLIFLVRAQGTIIDSVTPPTTETGEPLGFLSSEGNL